MPNSPTHRNSGIQEISAPVEWKPRNDSRWPSWKIQTRTPYAAPTDSRLRMIALTGITIDRNVNSNRRNAAPSTKPKTIGRCDLVTSVKSFDWAVKPVTLALMPGTAPIVAGMMRSRRWFTASFDLGSEPSTTLGVLIWHTSGTG